MKDNDAPFIFLENSLNFGFIFRELQPIDPWVHTDQLLPSTACTTERLNCEERLMSVASQPVRMEHLPVGEKVGDCIAFRKLCCAKTGHTRQVRLLSLSLSSFCFQNKAFSVFLLGAMWTPVTLLRQPLIVLLSLLIHAAAPTAAASAAWSDGGCTFAGSVTGGELSTPVF